MKKKQDVSGYINRCPEYEACPLCYGCRKYDSSMIRCITFCGRDKAKNVCNAKRHKAELVAKMLSSKTIKGDF